MYRKMHIQYKPTLYEHTVQLVNPECRSSSPPDKVIRSLVHKCSCCAAQEKPAALHTWLLPIADLKLTNVRLLKDHLKDHKADHGIL